MNKGFMKVFYRLCLGLHKYPFNLRKLLLDLYIQLRNRLFNLTGFNIVIKIRANIYQNKIWSHVHGEYFVDVIDVGYLVRQTANSLDNRYIGGFTDL